jgi:hypothetical protein
VKERQVKVKPAAGIRTMDFGIKCQILKRSTGTRQRERKGENE